MPQTPQGPDAARGFSSKHPDGEYMLILVGYDGFNGLGEAAGVQGAAAPCGNKESLMDEH
jgi:hypothetical protein